MYLETKKEMKKSLHANSAFTLAPQTLNEILTLFKNNVVKHYQNFLVIKVKTNSIA